jgi:translocation protein SEC63
VTEIFIAAVLFYLLVVCIWKGSEIKSFKSFDPYEILEIDPSATEQEIKKAYKTLAKKYHPDFNPGDPDAQNKFIILNQAYRCLTDDEVKEKCKAFGNPDGANNYQVGIALPSALLNKKNRSIILALFFLVLLVFLPITIWMWYSEKEKYDGFGVNKQSIFQTLHFMRNENITVQNVMEMMASSLEMGPIQPVKKGQGQGLKDVSQFNIDS